MFVFLVIDNGLHQFAGIILQAPVTGGPIAAKQIHIYT